MSGYPLSWDRVTSLTIVLIPVSWLYRVAVALRSALYQVGVLRRERLPVPVIVVGNISVGGTGKTPLVLWLAGQLRAAGYAPGIVSRGYGSNATHPRAVHDNDDAATCGDEPVLLARRSGCPVWVGADRVAVAHALLAAHRECNVIVSDDGLQHYRLERDAEIAVIDGARGHGNGFLLPAGPLREPPSRLGRVNAIVVRGNDVHAAEGGETIPHFAMTLTPDVFHHLRNPKLTRGADEFRGLRLHAAAGIGNPDHFFNTLKELGLDFTPHSFPDHHPYARGDLAFEGCDAVLMTEKDAVKYAPHATEQHWALEVAAQVDRHLADLVIERIKNPPGIS